MKLFKAVALILPLLPWSSLTFAEEEVRLGRTYSDYNCSWCHGPSLQGFTTAPRLAGQRAAYLVAQLFSFKTHARDNPLSKDLMWGPARRVNEPIAHELAAYLSQLPAKPADDGNRHLVSEGQDIYSNGNPEGNVVSCLVCHGPSGEGAGAIPRLGGLSYNYLRRRLRQWDEGYHASAAAPMPGIAGKLSDHEIEAVASYLSFVR